MAEDTDDEDKVVDASPRRRQEAREKGQVALSSELVVAALLAGFQDAPKRRGFLGAQVTQDGAVLRVERVIPNGPAEKAGLVVGDRILQLNGAAVTTVQAFVKAMQDGGAGGEFKFQVSRGNREYEVKIVLALHPEEADPSPGMNKVKKTLDIAYGDHERHKLNLFLPETDKPFPTVMWIHAGAWSFGGRENETEGAQEGYAEGVHGTERQGIVVE